MHLRPQACLLSAAISLVCAGPGFAQSADALKGAVQKALVTNPEVSARFNAYRASGDAVDVARGGYYPRLDLNASAGRDRDDISSRTPERQSITRSGASLSLTQLLWDGLTTRHEVGRLGHERLARYFEVLDITEQTALEASRAYYDVLRYRRLVALAEDNYVQHRAAFNQIQSRYKAGVGRGVDLEQAGARLALAESNLTTEMANLHDVSTRYQRIVGEAPPKDMPLPPPFGGLPASARDASDEAVRRNPAISASIESLRSARAAASARNGAFQPKLEARLRSGAGKNFDGVRDQRHDSSAELVLNWNLFNGGSDAARVRQQAHVVNQAADLRDRACRDTRQTIAIAYNDTRKLTDQLVLLDRNTLAIEKARDAYRQQFDIGQRSLLDLLNSENELYTARRSYANAEYDLAVAYVRAHAALGRLTSQLGLSRETLGEAPEESSGWAAGDDGPARCPTTSVEAGLIDTEALNARAAALNPPAEPRTASPIAPRPTPAASAPTPAAQPAFVPAAPAALQPGDKSPAAMSLRRLEDWLDAWAAKDLDRYLSFYARDFAPSRQSVDQWKAQRRRLVTKRGPIGVKLERLQTRTLGPDLVETRFRQSYRSVDYNDVAEKVLTWQQVNGQWLIVKESNR